MQLQNVPLQIVLLLPSLDRIAAIAIRATVGLSGSCKYPKLKSDSNGNQAAGTFHDFIVGHLTYQDEQHYALHPCKTHSGRVRNWVSHTETARMGVCIVPRPVQ